MSQEVPQSPGRDVLVSSPYLTTVQSTMCGLPQHEPKEATSLPFSTTGCGQGSTSQRQGKRSSRAHPDSTINAHHSSSNRVHPDSTINALVVKQKAHPDSTINAHHSLSNRAHPKHAIMSTTITCHQTRLLLTALSLSVIDGKYQTYMKATGMELMRPRKARTAKDASQTGPHTCAGKKVRK
eukprot:72137-Pelagomonas_calceolata.AAC.2